MPDGNGLPLCALPRAVAAAPTRAPPLLPCACRRRWHNNTTVHTGKLGVGTLRYMAPELLLGHYGQGPDSQPMTNRVDIYRCAFGLCDALTRVAHGSALPHAATASCAPLSTPSVRGEV